MSSTNDEKSPRRGSFANQRLSEMFAGRSASVATNGTPPFPGPISAAAHQANQRRRMSVATVGLGASPSATSPFGIRPRHDSLSSNGSAMQGESAIDDSGDASSPTHGFGRRLSMGSKAMSNMASGSMLNGKSSIPPSNTQPSRARESSSVFEEGNEEEHQTQPPSTSSPSSNLFNRRTGEGGGGFNWSNEMRNRAQRSASSSSPTTGTGFPRFQKSASVSAAPAAPAPAPAIKQQAPPDHFQERILKGDFYMD